MTYRAPCTTLADFEDLASNVCARLDGMMPAGDPHRRIPRKWWEFHFLAHCVENCVGFDGRATALGLGVGFEPLIFYFARGCQEVLATDLYSSDSAWNEARVDDPSFVYSKAPFDFDRRRVRVQSADMRNVPLPDGGTDFVWSCSSIEHVPTLRDLHATFHEIHRVLKPGGHALLTTEYCISQGPYLLRSLNAMDGDLFPRLVGGLDGLELVGPVNLQYNWDCRANHSMDRHYLPVAFRHWDRPLQELEGPQMANYAGVSQVTPIGFVLRKTDDGRPLRRWEDLDLAPEIREYTDMLDALGRQEYASAVRIGQPYCEGARGADLGLQFRLHWMRFFLEALVRTQTVPTASRLEPWLDRMAAMLPAGEVQDADCLDLHTYLCGVFRKYDLAVEILPKAIRSPSTTASHALKLACRLLMYGNFAGRFDPALDTLRSQWDLLAAHGSVTPIAVQDFLGAFWQMDLADPQRKQALQAVREALAPYPESLDTFARLWAGSKPAPGQFLRRLRRWFSPSGADHRNNVVHRLLGLFGSRRKGKRS